MKRLWLLCYQILCPFHEDHHKKSKWMNTERNPWSKANEEKREVLSGIVLLQWGCREETPLGAAVYSHQNTPCIENSFVNLSRQKIYGNVTFYSQSPHQSDESADSTSRKQESAPLSLREGSCWHLFLWHLLLELKSLGTLTSVYAVSLLYHRCCGRKGWRWLKYPVSLLSSNWIVSCSSCLVPGAKAGIQNGQKNTGNSAPTD